jgi:hypothetical protein
MAIGSSASFAVGLAAGWAVAPVFAVFSFARRARTFHPCGPTFVATVRKAAEVSPEFDALAHRLVGRALVRFSGALWKRAEGVPDVLGCAVRLRRDDREEARPAADDQDLLFATIQRPWMMPLAPFTTNVKDFLNNDYFAVAPFDGPAGRSVYLQLRPLHSPDERGKTRAERLIQATEHGCAVLSLEIGEGPFGRWSPLLTITLERVAAVDGQALRFNPFRSGRGVHPRGFIHALRMGAYALSQRVRPERTSALKLPPESGLAVIP